MNNTAAHTAASTAANEATLSASSRSLDATHRERATNKLTAAEKMAEAVARIEASRFALIVTLSPTPPERHGGASGDATDGGNHPSFAESLAARIKRNGALQGSWLALRTVARRWWTRQPWHTSVDLVTQTLACQARPLMRRHPLATLAVGTAVGAGVLALVTTVKPWAWHRKHGKGMPWGDRLGSLLWTQLTSTPVQMALAGAVAAWLADQGSRHAQSDDAPMAQPPA